jgi:sigma-B regulation protein RsbU (phosphoserine phosphatase)
VIAPRPIRGLYPAGLPAIAVAVVIVTDLLLTDTTVLGLVVVAPLLAANFSGPWATGFYGVLALGTEALLGVTDGVYSPGDRLAAQLVRLGSIALVSVLAVSLCRHRLARERRLTQVTKVAEAAQRAILVPVPERLGPARIAVRYESAASDALIGGDMYGVALTPHGLRVLVGDVRGKGLGAVRMSAQVLSAFRERAGDDADLSVLLDHMDHTVARAAVDDEEFVTAILVQLDPTGRVTVVGAGHPYPFALSAGRARLLSDPSPRPPLGLGGRAEPQSLQLQAGDRLLLYTDGLTEARDPRTRSFLPTRTILGALVADREPAEAVAALRQDVLQWSGGVLHDDIALVLLEYQPD